MRFCFVQRESVRERSRSREREMFIEKYYHKKESVRKHCTGSDAYVCKATRSFSSRTVNCSPICRL
jgi:hypothetical protein